MANRRAFLGMMAAGAVLGSNRPGRAAPSDRVRVAVIGLRSRGTDLVGMFSSNPGCELAAVCDVDESMFAKPLGVVESKNQKAPRTEKDFRRLLDDKSIDAVAIAAPDHWHALMTVMACQAGKDVYVEKPVSHNVVEGRRMVQAARKYERVVQAGTQRRSTDFVAEAVNHVHSGAIGKVGMAKAWIHQTRKSIGHGKPGPVPAGVDYAMWQGPAPDRPFYANRFHYNWHWFWNWGTGELGNNGIHGVDVARWGLGVEAPLTVSSSGGKFVFDDDQEVPDTQIATWEFPGACLVWEHRMWSNHREEGTGFGIAFYGAKGTLVISEKSWKADGVDLKPGKPARDGQAAHVQNFVDCIKTRNKPNAEIETAFVSTRLCLLGNIAYRVGKKLSFDPAGECFHDVEADALLSRQYGSRFEMPSQV